MVVAGTKDTWLVVRCFAWCWLPLVEMTTSGGAVECPLTRGSSFVMKLVPLPISTVAVVVVVVATGALLADETTPPPLLALLYVRFRDATTGRC